jgi:hypothetical protein
MTQPARAKIPDDDFLATQADVLARLPGQVADARRPEGLPPHLVLTERAVADFAAFLEGQGCGEWTVIHSADDEIYDIDQWLPRLVEEDQPVPQWEPCPTLSRSGGRQPTVRNDDGDAVMPGALYPPGFLLLRDYGVAVARWYWIDPEFNAPDTLWLAACASPEQYQQLKEKIRQMRHGGTKAVWQVVRGGPAHDGPRVKRRRDAGKELVLTDAIQQQVERDLLGFFKPKVKRLYKKLDVPYRRGVLLHGPPGNGKTSLIRMVGAKLPRIPFLLLRSDREIDDRAFRRVVDRWQKQAPAVLVIEDLNWLLKIIDVAHFLNLLDGIEQKQANGLLMIATTNYPDQLDPAVNNRPGRFDVSIELPNPEESLRRAFFDKELPDLADDTRAQAARKSDRLSFAHLREVLRLSGLLAIDAGRAERNDDDVLEAVKRVWESHDRALRGFPKDPDLPFGLQHQKKR